MTALNMRALQTVTVGAGGTSAIQFNSIPQGYTDLKIVLSLRATSGAAVSSYINQINGAGYTASQRVLSADGGTVYTSSTVAWFTEGSSYTANAFTSVEVYIPNYTSSNAKTLLLNWTAENDAVGSSLGMTAYLTNVTAAIQQISFSCDNTFAQYSTATLYGIQSAAPNAKATGGIISQDASYFYHIFPATGTFTPSQNLTCDYLVVAGGGGTQGDRSGGGGGGGVRCTVGATGGGGSLPSAVALTSGTAYTVTVGAGGTARANGSASSIAGSGLSTISTTGGGAGGGGGAAAGNGGSGGGGYGVSTFSGGTGTANEGYAGGTGYEFAAGGGGGAAALGQAGTRVGTSATATGGNGGDGILTAISGSSLYYAGGGGGYGNSLYGSGGLGGGGNGSEGDSSLNNTSGAANTGGGAGGGHGSMTGNGGSGIVIIRYAK